MPPTRFNELHTTYFGRRFRRTLRQATDLPESSGVRYGVIAEPDFEQKRLKRWYAWDPGGQYPCTGFHPNIWCEDFPKIGCKIAEMFPEPKSGGSQR